MEIFEELMNVASSDEELHEDFFSGKELASTPDDSEVPKIHRVTYQTQTASSHTETPVGRTPEAAEAPSMPKVGHSLRTTVIEVVTINDTIDRLTIENGCTSRDNVSISRIKRPLEQNLQAELKRMTLGENPSSEHGVLVAQDFRWLSRQRTKEVQRSPTCWNPDTTG